MFHCLIYVCCYKILFRVSQSLYMNNKHNKQLLAHNRGVLHLNLLENNRNRLNRNHNLNNHHSSRLLKEKEGDKWKVCVCVCVCICVISSL